MTSSNYSYNVEGAFVCIEDLKAGKSVTNDIESVIRQIGREIGNLNDKLVIYKDSFRSWDQVVLDPFGHFVRFELLSTNSKEVAKLLVTTAQKEGKRRPWTPQSFMESK